MTVLPPTAAGKAFDRLHRLADLMADERARWEDPLWLRFAALSAVLAQGRAEDIAERIRGAAARLKQASGWTDALASRARFVFAALLVAADAQVNPFLEQVRHCRTLFERVGMRARTPHAVLSILILHLDGGGPVSASRIAAIRAIYDLMKRKHWWLTGEDDLPACALLSVRHGTPEDVADRLERIYAELRHGGLSSGNHLQAAASLLLLADMDVLPVTDRYQRLIYAAERRLMSIVPQQYDAFAVLCLLDGDLDLVIDELERNQDRIKGWDKRIVGGILFALAADLTLLDALSGSSAARPVDSGKVRMLQAATTTITLNAIRMTGVPFGLELP